MILPLAHLGGVRLSAFVDGEMDPDEAHRWRLHLIQCASCSAAVSAEREVRHRVRHSCVPAPTSTLLMSLRVVASPDGPGVPADAVAGRLTLHPQSRIPLTRRLPFGVVAVTTTAAAAAVVGLAVSGFGFGTGAPAPRPAAAVNGPFVPAALTPAVAPDVPSFLAPRSQPWPMATPTGLPGGSMTPTPTGRVVSTSSSAPATISWLTGAGTR